MKDGREEQAMNRRLIGALSAVGLTFGLVTGVQAALIDRGGGLIYGHMGSDTICR